MHPIHFVVDHRESGKTLAAILKQRYSLTWAQAKRLIDGRHVRVSGHVETDEARRLKTGKPVSITTGAIDLKSKQGGKPPKKPAVSREATPSAAAKPKPNAAAKASPKPKPTRRDKSKSPSPLTPESLVYIDDAVVVVNKPAGLTTMRHAEEAAEFGERSQRFLTHTLASLLPAALGTPNRKVIAVHRLDRDTSGLVVFARTQDAAANLTQQFRKHTAERRYLALTRGVPQPGRLESTLVRNRGDDRRGSSRKTNTPDGKKAVTHVKVVEAFEGFALVECRLETGRTHQVRIHLGEVGNPLCGERVYDREVNRKALPDGSGAARPMLHAAKLGFRHPETDEAMKWESPPPADFAALLQKLRDGNKVTSPQTS
jgi:23S rRNA pseudouridine1911/1915/1917 synthase